MQQEILKTHKPQAAEERGRSVCDVSWRNAENPNLCTGEGGHVCERQQSSSALMSSSKQISGGEMNY